MPEVNPTLNSKKVRKWRRMLIAIADETATVPTAFFGVDHLPIALPTGYKDLGFITTDGATASDAITSEPTAMLQSLEPVRTDVTGREQSLTVAFGESNAWTNAMSHGLPVADWPEDRDGPWVYDDGEVSDWPYYRLFLIGQDGVGSWPCSASSTATAPRSPRSPTAAWGRPRSPSASRSACSRTPSRTSP